MESLKNIRLSWPAFAGLAIVSAAATLFILAGGGGRSAAQAAALAALKNPPKVVTPAASPASSGSGNTSGSQGLGGGQGSGGSGGNSSSPQTATSTPTSTSQQTATTTPQTTTSSTPPKHHHHKPAAPPDAGLPHVGHVFEIALSTNSFNAAFGPHSQATYLHTLIGRGALLTNYESFGHSSELTDYLATISGQGPNTDTAQGCPKYKSFPTSASANAKGIVSGTGCIYPDTALTIADQTGIAGQTWGAYIQSMGAKTSCQYPEPGESQSKGILGTEPGYSLNHNPFVYFESLLEEGACDSSDVDLSFLSKALKSPSKTPNFSYIAPNECADSDPVIAPAGGSGTTTGTTTAPTTTTAPAVGCPAGQPNGIKAEDTFLQTVVPEILKSGAYKQNGVLVIEFAAAGDKSSAKMVRTGALVLSRHTKHGLKVGGDYGPYALLRSVEDMLNYQPLAHAATAGAFAKRVLR